MPTLVLPNYRLNARLRLLPQGALAENWRRFVIASSLYHRCIIVIEWKMAATAAALLTTITTYNVLSLANPDRERGSQQITGCWLAGHMQTQQLPSRGQDSVQLHGCLFLYIGELPQIGS